MFPAHLDLLLPDWAALDNILRSPMPFALWTIGDQCLLHHWLDYAVNQNVKSIHVFTSDRPAAVRRVIEDSVLWPLTIECTAIRSDAAAPSNAVLAGWLPGEVPPAAPVTGWELIDRAAGMENAWLDRMFDLPDFNLVSIGFSCRIHPEATLVPPYFIGDHVFIGPGCRIGPYAVIGEGSVISGANQISHSHLSAYSFLGPVTALNHCRLEDGVLFNLTHRARLDQMERHLFSSLKPSPATPLKDRIHALWLYLRLGGGRSSAQTFRTFDGRTLPGSAGAGLVNRLAWLPLVWQGKLPLYGVLPRSKEQFDSLTPEWQDAIRHSPIGVFSYADSQGCHVPSDPEEAVHAVYQASLPSQTLAAPVASFVRNLRSADVTRATTSS